MGCLCSRSTASQPQCQHIEHNCFGKVDTCTYLQRLAELLQYYDEWTRSRENEEGKELENELGIYGFINGNSADSYGVSALLNTYHHMIKDHDADFESVYNFLSQSVKCPMISCNLISRNHRDRSQSTTESRSKLYYNHKDHNEVITQQIMDQIHCYCYHSLDIGYRTIKENDDSKSEEKADDINSRKQQQIRSDLRRNDLNKFVTVINTANADDLMYSFGIRYYYGDKYENNEGEDIEHNLGYKYSDWFIRKPYKNLKIELLQNKSKTVTDRQYRDLVKKSKIYLKTEYCAEYKNLEIQNLIAIMIYCNFQCLQLKFTQTYRHFKGETDDALRLRHSEFANLGRILMDTVEFSGIRVETRKCRKFYHGLNMRFYFSSTLHKFNGPTSTSSEYEVAVSFADQNGIILQLNDAKLLSHESNCKYFNCEWISDYGYEKERFFIGGKTALKIVNIYDVNSGEHYLLYIKLFNILLSITKNDVSINNNRYLTAKNEKGIVKLLKHELNEKTMNGIPQYMETLLHHICVNIIRFETRYNETFGSFKANSNTIKKYEKYKILSSYLCKTDCDLFILSKLSKLFPNLTSISIERSILSANVFDDIYEFLRDSATQSKECIYKLKSIIFKSPKKTSSSSSFRNIIDKYSPLYNEFKWKLDKSKLHKDWLIIHNEDETISADIKKAGKTFTDTEKYIINSSYMFSSN